MLSATEPGLILIISAQGPVRDLMELTLASEGHGVLCAPDGAAALDYLRANTLPELILLDLSRLTAGARDGLATLHRLKDDAGLRHIPVAILTGPAQAPDQSLAWMLGADFRLQEPLSMLLLTRIARETCSRRLTAAERELLGTV